MRYDCIDLGYVRIAQRNNFPVDFPEDPGYTGSMVDEEMKMVKLPATAAEALSVLMTLKMRPFTEADWDAYSGCDSTEPLICETDDYTVIIDGDIVTFDEDVLLHDANVVEFKLSLHANCIGF